MLRVFRTLFVIILPVVFSFLFILSSFAQTLPPFSQSLPPECQPKEGVQTFLINGCDVGQHPELFERPDLNFKGGLKIDGTVRKVILSFVGLEDGRYYLCGNRDSIKPDHGCGQDDSRYFDSENGEIHIEVCAGGDNWLKGRQVTDATGTSLEGGKLDLGDRDRCDEEKDWFHEGEFYALGLYEDDKTESNVMTAEFFVQHSNPVVKITSENGGDFNPLEDIIVTLYGRRPEGDKENNYQVVLEGLNNEYKKELCIDAEDNSQTGVGTPGNNTVEKHAQGVVIEGTEVKLGEVIQEDFLNGTGRNGIQGSGDDDPAVFNRGNQGGVGKGSFVLKVNERMKDNRGIGFLNECEGGHSYVYIYFTLDPELENGIKIFDVRYDPNNADWEDIYEGLLDVKDWEAPDPPCILGGETNSECTAVDTALGKIDTTVSGFVSIMFRFVLVLAGFGGVIILIYSGYLIMRSQGDKEKVAAARETITSAILGLLFIIFSIVILEIIGVDILKIPGFER